MRYRIMSKLSKYPPKGFTLIELLVVVLIIGILAAIALPQYRRIVEKSRASETLILMNAINKAVDVYYLTHNEFPKKFADLDIEIPWTGNEPWYITSIMSDFISNGVYSIGLEGNNSNYYSISAVRLGGYYKGGGFGITKKQPGALYYEDQIMCGEWLSGDITFDKKEGSFCFGIMGADSLLTSQSWSRTYLLK